MIYAIFLVVCFGASVVGAICGIGGGVIIKPVLDAVGVMNVSAISFLSGCTVLSMTTYSVLKNKLSGQSTVERQTGVPLAIGAAVGGLVGKWLFAFVKGMSENPNRVGAVQAFCLIVVTIGTLTYTIYRHKIKTHHIKSALVCAVIGVILGIMSSFLGIGGGPINLVVLYFFFSMSTKAAAENSLYIIFFSQLASLGCSILTLNVPGFSLAILIIMVVGGITGGMVGHEMNRRLKETTVDKLFIGLMILIIIINIYNVYKLCG